MNKPPLYTLLLAWTVLCPALQGQDQGPVNQFPNASRTYDPWGVAQVTSCYYITPVIFGVPTGPPRPVTGLHVSAVATPLTGSGWHGHEVAGNPRPMGKFYGQFLSSTISQTNGSGCVTWYYVGSGYSQWVTITTNPLNIQGQPQHKTQGENVYFGHYDRTLQGSVAEFINAPGMFLFAPFTNYGDPRHQDNQRYATRVAQTLLSLIAKRFWLDYPNTNPNEVQLNYMRSSLRNGGISDSQFSATFGSGLYFYPEWKADPAEQHLEGVSMDIGNPSIVPPGDPPGAPGSLFLLFNRMVNEVGCKLSRVDPNGSSVQPDGPNGYWASQPIVHVLCADHERTHVLPGGIPIPGIIQ